MTTRFICLTAATIALLAACSSSSSTGGDSGTVPCNENPFQCSSGQTCWPKDTVPTFTCLNSGSGKKGDPCLNTPDSATCGDGLACLQLVGATGGACVAYCDSTNTAHACATGETCTLAYIGTPSGPKIHVCVGGSPPHDGGTDSGSDSSSGDGSAD